MPRENNATQRENSADELLNYAATCCLELLLDFAQTKALHPYPVTVAMQLQKLGNAASWVDRPVRRQNLACFRAGAVSAVHTRSSRAERKPMVVSAIDTGPKGIQHRVRSCL